MLRAFPVSGLRGNLLRLRRGPNFYANDGNFIATMMGTTFEAQSRARMSSSPSGPRISL